MPKVYLTSADKIAREDERRDEELRLLLENHKDRYDITDIELAIEMGCTDRTIRAYKSNMSRLTLGQLRRLFRAVKAKPEDVQKWLY